VAYLLKEKSLISCKIGEREINKQRKVSIAFLIFFFVFVYLFTYSTTRENKIQLIAHSSLTAFWLGARGKKSSHGTSLGILIS
jgi:hypothetical protein